MKIHLCKTCNEMDPTLFYDRYKGICKTCYIKANSERSKRYRNKKTKIEYEDVFSYFEPGTKEMIKEWFEKTKKELEMFKLKQLSKKGK